MTEFPVIDVMTSKAAIKKFTLVLMFLGGLESAAAFEISGIKWPNAQTEFHVALQGVSAAGISWNNAFIGALNEWNQRTDFNFILREEFRDPCASNGVNGVDFTDDICGTEYGNGTLAVTIRKFSSQILGPPRMSEADVVINNGVNYNIFDGNLVQLGIGPGEIDFRRVALHELGHVIGLDHEPEQLAIMQAHIGNIDRVQADDISGVNTLYGGLSNCFIHSLRFGPTQNGLQPGDCTVDQLTLGEGDDSFIDLYQFTLASPATLEFEMTSAELDSILVLADANLNFLAADELSAQRCDSRLRRSLAPGTYFILANTFNEPVKPECGNTGTYVLNANISSSDLLPLGANSSLLGDVSSATFAGGITRNNGLSYESQFNATDSLDIRARIVVDPTHVGEAGFLVVAAAIGNQILVLNSAGQFVPYTPDGSPVPQVSEKTLLELEVLSIADDLVPAQLGINEIVVDFVVGYGLQSAPGEIYFHQTPLTLRVSR